MREAERRRRMKAEMRADAVGRHVQAPQRKIPIPSKSRFGFDVVSADASHDRRVPFAGPGNRKIPMTLPRVNLPPAYEEDDE